MAKRRNRVQTSETTSLGYEAELWRMADALRGSMDAAEYKHVILGLIFPQVHPRLAPTGVAGFVLANGSMSWNQSGEGEIREANLVNCMVTLPDKLFYSTQIPACLWFLGQDKIGRPPAGRKEPLRDRCGEVLFIDARKMGRMVDRTHHELTDEEIRKIADTYHAWCSEKGTGEYQDVPGFCKNATLEEIRKHGYVLTPGRYVDTEFKTDDDEAFK